MEGRGSGCALTLPCQAAWPQQPERTGAWTQTVMGPFWEHEGPWSPDSLVSQDSQPLSLLCQGTPVNSLLVGRLSSTQTQYL